MEFVAFTLVAVFAYLMSDWLLDQAERMAKRRFKHRNIIFFVLITALALVSFKAANLLMAA